MSRLFVNRLTLMDFSYLDPCLGLLGETWQMDLELAGELDEQGMVLDFGLIKKRIKGFVDQAFDHRLLIPEDHPGCHIEEQADSVLVVFDYAGGRQIRHSSPASALCRIPAQRIDTAIIAASMRQRLLPLLPENCHDVVIRLHAEPARGASYRYSHGLKRHDGNCRRIAHGHRSRLEIERDGKPDEQLAAAWAEEWRHIYLGCRADLRWQGRADGHQYCRFAYDTAAGRFELQISSDTCVLIDSETTVENIAQHIADQLASRHPGSAFRVRAFEGADKGALATSGG
jgi:6-pyruvoyl-tetrahydropterin synthase